MIRRSEYAYTAVPAHPKIADAPRLVTLFENNNGTLLDGPVWIAGKAGGGLSFNGVDDNVAVSNSS